MPIAEITAVLGVLNSVNSAVATLKETTANVNSLQGAFGRVTKAAEGIASVEAQAKAGLIELSTKDAMELAQAKRNLANYEKKIKEACIYSGQADLWDEMKKIQRDSIAAVKKRQAKQKAKARARKASAKEFGRYVLAVFLALALIAIIVPFTIWYLGN